MRSASREWGIAEVSRGVIWREPRGPRAWDGPALLGEGLGNEDEDAAAVFKRFRVFRSVEVGGSLLVAFGDLVAGVAFGIEGTEGPDFSNDRSAVQRLLSDDAGEEDPDLSDD